MGELKQSLEPQPKPQEEEEVMTGEKGWHQASIVALALNSSLPHPHGVDQAVELYFVDRDLRS